MKLKKHKILINLITSFIKETSINGLVMNMKYWWLSSNIKRLCPKARLEEPKYI